MIEPEMLDLLDASNILNVMPEKQEFGRVRYVTITSSLVNPKTNSHYLNYSFIIRICHSN
jgi:hypothetical protein